jgi:hypothetical protein
MTPAGTVIENEATGTYQDPNTGEIQQVTSNKVTVTVAEVAGITVTAAGVRSAAGTTSISAGTLLYFDYTVTNVGNDPTKFHIPNLATVTGPGAVTGNLLVSTDGGATWADIAANSALPGFTFTNNYVETASFAPTQSIRVRVPVTVSATATRGEQISVRLGNTPDDAQNVERSANPEDIYTIDNPDGVARETPGVPVNGTREASATQTATVGKLPLALAALYKTVALPVNAGNPGNPTDDVITYNLALDVRSVAPTGAGDLAPADLAGTPITLNGNSATRILISDAIPAGTRLTGNPTAPTGWIAVYTKDSPSAITALQAQWRTNPNDPAIGGLANVTRIGFVFDGTVPKGTTVTGFSFGVVTSGITGTTTISNIAQVFGATSGAANSLVYDESGDQNPNNFNDDGTAGDPAISYGIANPATDGTDASNNNTGTGPGGEDTTVTVPVPVLPGALLNGPQGAPAAVGPTGNNDDFTNLSAAIPAGLPPDVPVDAAPVTFTNTVQNTGSVTATITLVPTPPANPADLPAGTAVTLTYGNQSATYTYTGSAFTTSSAPLSIPNLAPNQTANYTVRVDLPAAPQLLGFPVPVTAFIDTNRNGVIDAGEPADTTIDRVYTGFLQIVKESRLLKGTGPDVPQGSDSFSTASKTGATGNIIEYRLTYTNISTGSSGTGSRILNASNIVITEDGTTYDSSGNPAGNSWALDVNNRDGDSNPTTGIDTSNVPGSAADSAGGIITFFSGKPATTPASDISGTTAATDVTRYVNTVRGPLGPGQSGTFTFQRRVN